MKKLLYLFCILLLSTTAYGQDTLTFSSERTPLIKDFDISSTESSLFRVLVDSSYTDSTGATIENIIQYSRHQYEYTAAEGLLRARMAYPNLPSWVERNQRLELDTEFAYAGIDTVYISDTPEPLRNIGLQMAENDTSSQFQIIMKGTTTADEIKYASKCIGYDSTNVAIDNRIAMTVAPDTTGAINATSDFYTCLPTGGNALMTIWLTARKDTLEMIDIRFKDVAHIRGLGN